MQYKRNALFFLFPFFFLILLFTYQLIFSRSADKLICASSTHPLISSFPICRVVVDAGHGKPDGGAVSKDGIEEADLNLQIAQKLEEALLDEGFEVVMTRKDENNIAPPDKQSTIREMKVSDIQNRIALVNSSNADILISIHMNNFSATQYHGWQTFYQKNFPESKLLAESIQSEITNSIGKENARSALKIENIKLLDESKIPSVIVECGFLSNEEEKKLLQQEEYQEKIVQGIVNGIEKLK